MASSTSSQAQFHHFIPRFILNNFSHGNSSPWDSSSKIDQKSKIYFGEQMLRIINLKNEVPKITVSPVKRTFGMMDMYLDASNTADHHFLEKELSKLESKAASTIAHIKKVFDSGKVSFSMSRDQRDLLRKFLFIMKYRGPNFHERFHGDESGKYNKDDMNSFGRYMQENGFINPVDVWHKSIQTILNLKMDVEGKWKETLLASIYPDDAKWFIMHTEMFFLAFCTPDNPNDEFILTENCYNVHEGPNATGFNSNTSEYEVVSWISYHEFSPITPKLMLVLRSFLLPNDEEDANEHMKKWRDDLYQASTRSHADPATAKSILEDLPVKKARNSYSQITAGGIQLLPNEDGSRRSSHQFTFSFFKINKDQVYRINSILLENAHLTSAIAFSSEISLAASLKHFLELPADRGFKVVRRQDPNDVRLLYLQKLESIAKSLVSFVKLVYKETPGVEDIDDVKSEVLAQLRQDMSEHMSKKPSEPMQLYSILGGNCDTLKTDVVQATRMRYLRIKIDVATKGLHEARREKVREDLRDLYCQLPTRRLWLYLKPLRSMALGPQETFEERLGSQELMEGPEDVIIKISHIVRPECLGLLMHFAVIQDIQHRLNPGLNPSSDFDLDVAGYKRLQKIKGMAFYCGLSLRLWNQAHISCRSPDISYAADHQSLRRLQVSVLEYRRDHRVAHENFSARRHEIDPVWKFIRRSDSRVE
ncbi:hypothetical protein EJ02DRAFT_507895 [Clathrospora elynae]|uniref:DUF4238 domain-containing protein n=1 Tax=Clathrospora elynae TaxID=706981 RepID=A0A6A5T3A4_9PLEO|nr:hypothetical protein EJ02DRAFT_507895 [Clathrospora elynae]